MMKVKRMLPIVLAASLAVGFQPTRCDSGDANIFKFVIAELISLGTASLSLKIAGNAGATRGNSEAHAAKLPGVIIFQLIALGSQLWAGFELSTWSKKQSIEDVKLVKKQADALGYGGAPKGNMKGQQYQSSNY